MTTRLTVPIPAEVDERVLCNITVADAAAHRPDTDPWDPATQRGMQAISVADLTRGWAIACLNLTNQAVTLTLRGCTNLSDAPLPGVAARFSDDFDVTIVVPAASSFVQPYTPTTTGWLPIIWASVQAAVAPTTRLTFTAVASAM